MKENLDNYVDAYGDDFKYSFDNQIIMKWYPQRIIQKMICGSLLELGLGHGHTISEFLESGKVLSYKVIEGSNEIIARFKRQEGVNKVEVVHSYFEDFFTEDRYDNIVMGFVMEHVEDPHYIVSKYRNFLKKNGRIFLAVPNSEALNRRLGYKAGMIKSLDQLSAFDIQLGHKRFFNLESLFRLVQDNGLAVKSVEGLFLKPFSTDQLKSLNLSDNVLTAMLAVGIEFPELCTGILLEAAVE